MGLIRGDELRQAGATLMEAGELIKAVALIPMIVALLLVLWLTHLDILASRLRE